MTDENCQGPAYDGYNQAIYFGVQGLEGGDIQMGTYSDDQCIYPIETDITYDDFKQQEGVDLGSKDQGDHDDGTYDDITEWWYGAQEYTMELFNGVYDDYKYCTSCMDYPTYQDGYFIGDTGTDDDDLINQCWKFYSHDSYGCQADCVAMAALQGNALQVTVNGKTFGRSFDGQYDGQHTSSSSSNAANAHATRIERLKANLYLTMSGIVFVATFLAFAVARGSSKKKKASSRSRSRRLLDADYGGESSRRRSSSRKSSSRTSSRSASRSRPSSSSRSKSRSRRSEGDYKSPSSASGDRARSKSRSRTSSSSRK